MADVFQVFSPRVITADAVLAEPLTKLPAAEGA